MALKLAQDELQLFEKYAHPKESLTLQRSIELRRSDLNASSLRGLSDVLTAENYLRFFLYKQKLRDERIKVINQVIADTKRYAPTDGVVIHASSNGAGRIRWDKPPIALGDGVYPREEIVHIIASDRRHAEITLMESEIHTVQPGQAVNLTVEALPGRAFTGRVERIDVMPVPRSYARDPNVRQYRARVIIDSDTTGLKPGMNANAEIVIRQAADVLAVPVEAVTERIDPDTETPYSLVYVSSEKGPEPRPVTVGLRGAFQLEIQSGLAAGELVLLNPAVDSDTR
jgi:multidrug efflux pump subunit AcrA (membrane-fusion protein)